MFIDIVDMRDFYDGRLGQMARLMIGRRVRALWPDLRGLRLMGLGFATPYLRPYLAEAERLYRRFHERVAEAGVVVATGVFRAMMKVELVNDGPVTFLLDSRKQF